MKKSIYMAPETHISKAETTFEIMAATVREQFGYAVDSDTNGGSFVDEEYDPFANNKSSLWDE